MLPDSFVFAVVPSEELGYLRWASNLARLCDIETG